MWQTHTGMSGPHIRSNIVIFQGIPISAQLFIIYEDTVTTDYADKINITDIQQISITLSSTTAEHKWTSDLIQQNKFINTMGGRAVIYAKLENRNIDTKNSNYALCAEDTSFGINNRPRLESLLNTYRKSTGEYSLRSQRSKVLIRKTKFLKQIPKPHPNTPYKYNQIQCATYSNIIGHQMTDGNNLSIATNDRLQRRK